MKKFLLFAVLAFALVSCMSAQKGGRSASVTRADRPVGKFKAVRVEGAVDVVYAQGKDCSVSVVAPQSYLSRVMTEVKDGVLVVRFKSGMMDLLRDMDDQAIRVRVTSPDLVAVSVVGSGDFECERPLDTDRLSLLVRGSGDIDFRSVICDDLTLRVDGSGDIEVDKADALRADASVRGSGDVKLRLKNTRKTSVELAGSGDVEVDFEQCGVADCLLTGSGDITLSGTLELLNQNVRGSGDLHTALLRLHPVK